MSKFLKIFAPAATGTAGILGIAYMAADQFVADIPAPLRAGPAGAQEAAPDTAPEMTATSGDVAMAAHGPYGLGREATAEEIAAWDVNVTPDGTGLPEGSGSVLDGETLFIDNCAACHGEFAEGLDNWPKLAGGDGTLADDDPVKTVGSYWPYLSTTWDYVHRSMPYGNAQMLSADDTYAIVAYILYSNYLVEDDFVLTKENFLEVEMPNAGGFFEDDRETAEAHFWGAEACMENCKDHTPEITKKATDLNVTPGQDHSAAAMVEETEAAPEDAAEAAAPEAVEEAAAEAPAAETAVAAVDPALVADGAKVFRKCQACHQVGEGASNRVGPVLNGVVGRAAATVDGFRYSPAMQAKGDEGLVWTEEVLHEYLANPRSYVKGTSMGFAGLRDQAEIDAVIAYIQSETP
ncbi:MAG: MFS transporter [Rhodobacterales bacterium]|nr:MAG: MFS transporter [Rhodobacterales bacterium]